MDIPDGLLEATVTDNGKLHELGVKIGKLYTDFGLPIDIALDRLPHTKDQKIAILSGAQWWLVEHRRGSGATDKALDRQRKANRQAMESFIKTGESGVY